MKPILEEPLLDLHDIQGNILEGFNKPHHRILGLVLEEITAAKRWLRAITPLITTLYEVHIYKQELRAFRNSKDGRRKPIASWMTLAFSWKGIRQLASDAIPAAFSQAFIDGQWRRSMSRLGDPGRPGKLGFRGDWIMGGSDDATPDIFIICAADRREDLDALAQRVIGLGTAEGCISILYDEYGSDLPARKGITGHEHFGFKDNISRPRSRGRTSEKDFLYQRDPNLSLDPTLPEFSAPGQPLVWPGQFVLGYETQSGTDARGCDPPEPLGLPWIKNGSYLVFRRLRQDVAQFRQFLRDETVKLRKEPFFADLTEERFAALIVGRWRNGTPLSLSPLCDDSRFTSPDVINDFVYLGKDWPQHNKSERDFGGSRCPVSAHIRKVNPRDQHTDLGALADNLRRLMLRRGIPYGPPLLDGEEQDLVKASVDRGLLFVSYQASIENTFETILQSWVNSTTGPTPPQVCEMLIGQNASGSDERFTVLKGVGGEARVSTNLTFVHATGGGYFFTPAISAVKGILA